MRGLARKVTNDRKKYKSLETIQCDPKDPKLFIVDGRSKAEVEELFSHLNVVFMMSLPEDPY